MALGPAKDAKIPDIGGVTFFLISLPGKKKKDVHAVEMATETENTLV